MSLLKSVLIACKFFSCFQGFIVVCIQVERFFTKLSLQSSKSAVRRQAPSSIPASHRNRKSASQSPSRSTSTGSGRYRRRAGWFPGRKMKLNNYKLISIPGAFQLGLPGSCHIPWGVANIYKRGLRVGVGENGFVNGREKKNCDEKTLRGFTFKQDLFF